MLQIAVHHHDEVAVCVVEAGGERPLVPEVARERQVHHPVVTFGERLEHEDAVVRTSVVDEEQRPGDVQLFEDGGEALVQQLEPSRLVVDRDHDAEPGRAGPRREREGQCGRGRDRIVGGCAPVVRCGSPGVQRSS